MANRYTDKLIKGDTRDFVPRDRKPTVFELTLIFLFALGLSVTLPVFLFDKMTLVFWLCLLLALAGWYVILELTRSRDLVLATEFQNALFASALGFNNKFCLIIKREGNIVYMDNGFQKMFPELIRERNVSVAGMLKHGKVGAMEKEKIFAALDRGVYDKVIFDITTAGGQFSKIVMSLEPIIRPSGFILLRARDFIERPNREGAAGEPRVSASANPLLSKSSITLFAYVMDRMNTGVYMTDATGLIIYANRLVEQWLAFRESEIINTNLTLKDIVHQGSSDPGAISPESFEGEVNLRKKEGGLIKTFINQKVILGEDGRLLGSVALVNNIVDKEPSTKKALW
jgi:two-component system cell cycle sensor histidine kinase/response regulator CckA